MAMVLIDLIPGGLLALLAQVGPVRIEPGAESGTQPLVLQPRWGELLPLSLLIGGLLILLSTTILYIRWLRRRNADLSSNLKGLIAERRRAERALRETEVFYHSLVETLPQMILRKDMEGRFTFVNQRFCNELARSLEEIVGKTDYDFFRRDLADKYRRDDRRVIESGTLFEAVEEHVTPQGETLYVQIMKTPLQGPDGKAIGIQGIFWDVTARRRAEERLKEQNQKLQEMARSEHEAHDALKSAQSRLVEQEKLASLGHLVAGVAHEINNPLAFVSNNVAVLDRDLRDLIELISVLRKIEARLEPATAEDRDQFREMSERIDLDYTIENLPRLIERTREGLRRIERIVKDLRLFARVDEGDWNEIDLNPGIESSVNMVKGYARKKEVTIHLDLGAMPPVLCRAAKIHQVVVNLLTNAIDACKRGGDVTVRTNTEPEVMGIRIEVIDSGCGIDPAVRERLFDPFFTTKPLGQGTGLGLSISYGIVREHGGMIEVDSKLGEGSHFTIHLPVAPERPLLRPTTAPLAAQPLG
jgi:PAS domain S-box-containing protein